MLIRKKTPLNGVTTTTVSSPINVENAKRVTFQFERSSHVSGSAIFTVQGSIDYSDGGDFVPTVNMFKNSPNDNTQTRQRVISAELSSDDKLLYALDLENFCYDYIQVKVTESGSGTSTCKCLIVE